MAKIVSDSWVMAEARDLKKSVAFYAKLGLKPAMRVPYYMEFKIPGGTVLGLHSAGGKKAHRGGSEGGWAIMLRVKNIKKTVSSLKRKRVLCTPVKTAPGGAQFSSFHDPDRNRFLLIQMGK